MNKFIRATTGSLCVIQLSAVVYAQEVTQPDVVADDEIIVTARRFLQEVSTSSTRLNLPIAETPQSITVFDEEFFKDLGLASYLDALDFIPGVDFGGNWIGANPDITSRGFGVGTRTGIKIDGLGAAAGRVIDNVAVERIEFVRGGSGTTFGEGSPGGFVNVITRAAQKEWGAVVTGELGSFDDRRISARFGGPIDKDGNIRFVIAGAVQAADSFVDFQKSKDDALYGAVEADITDTLSARAAHYRSNMRLSPVHNGWPARFEVDADGHVVGTPQFPFELPINTYTGATWTYMNLKDSFTSLSLRFQPSTAFGVSVEAMDGKADEKGRNADLCCRLDANFTTDRNYLSFLFDNRSRSLDVRITGELPAWDGKISYLVSGEYRKRFFKATDADYTYIDTIDIRNADLNVTPPLPGAGQPGFEDIAFDPYGAGTETYSASALAVVQPNPKLSITLGIRYDDFTPYFATYVNDRVASKDKLPSDNLALRFAAMYEVFKDVRAYYSYGDSFQANLSLRCDGSVLPPQTAKTHELGVKAKLTPALLLSAAVYDIKSRNNSILAPFDPSCAVSDATVGGKGQRSQGGEIEILGRIGRNLNLTASYAYVSSTASTSDGRFIQSQARPHRASVFAVYDFIDGTLTGLGIGGGFVYTSAYYATSEDELSQRLRLESEFRANASVYYKLTEQLELSFKVDNLFDEKHAFSALSSIEYQNLYQPPRQYTFSIEAKF